MASYVSQVDIGGSKFPIGSLLYGECAGSIAASTAAKVVNSQNLANFDTFARGITIHVKFINGNSATSPTLKVGTTDAKPIVNPNGNLDIAANSVVSLTYDGTSWVINAAKDTTYSTLDQTTVNTGEEETGKLVTAKIIKDTVTNAINDLDVSASDIIGFGADQTLQSLIETDGKISATFYDISIPWSKVTSQPTLGTAAAKNVATSAITDNDTGTDLPTKAQVATYVANKTSGLTGAMHFIGKSTIDLSIAANSAANPTINGYDWSKKAAGDVVLNSTGNKEYVWNGTAWIELGDEGSYALKTISITGSNGLTGGGTLEANQTISHAARNSSIASDTLGTTDSTRTYIKSITLDAYGHITGVGTGTETADPNTKLRIYLSNADIELPLVGLNSGGATAAYASHTSSTKDVYGAIPNTTTNRATINPNTGKITAPFFKGDGSELTNVIAASVTWENVTGKVTAARNTLGLVKTSSTVTSTSGLTAAPIIDGIVYYKDTDTHYTTHLYVTNSSGTAKTTTALTNGNVYLKLYDDTSAGESYKISGSGGATVTTDTSGNIIITSKTYSVTGSTTINYLKNANYVETASVSGGTLTITTIDDAPTIAAVTAIG